MVETIGFDEEQAVNSKDLKIGDKVIITSVPGEGVPDYFITTDTVKVFKKLIIRKRPVHINKIDEYGQPWYECRF